MNPNVDNLIGSGVVFNVEAFFKELAELESKGVPRVHERIHISSDVTSTSLYMLRSTDFQKQS